MHTPLALPSGSLLDKHRFLREHPGFLKKQQIGFVPKKKKKKVVRTRPRKETILDLMQRSLQIESVLTQAKEQHITPRQVVYRTIFLRSLYWKNKRGAILRQRGSTCQSCGVGHVPLNVHHKTYKRIGHEKSKDLMVLCIQCHLKQHEK